MKTNVDEVMVKIANKFGGKSYKEARRICNKARRALNKELERRDKIRKQIKKYTIEDFYL